MGASGAPGFGFRFCIRLSGGLGRCRVSRCSDLPNANQASFKLIVRHLQAINLGELLPRDLSIDFVLRLNKSHNRLWGQAMPLSHGFEGKL